ncbi:ComF family protein [Shimia ponticola]|uniref:ComF family protein n=1 Tax=Shimia ponticola TaxID=2582893 RepID=UPI0011BE12D9|nr:ComF family protein [Shimia ponticola]
MQGAVRLIYPGQCVSCDERVEGRHGICGPCWRDTPFIEGAVCGQCGTPLMGGRPDEVSDCDDCLKTPRPWDGGRAAMLYRGNGRKLVLSFKHGNREDMAEPLAAWMVQRGRDMIMAGAIVVPVPLHWTRLVRRRYNQAALLSRCIAKQAGLTHAPDALRRIKRTASLDRMSPEARERMLENAFTIHPRWQAALKGAQVLLIDDVMTSGATLTEATQVLRRGGVASVHMLTLARAAKDA